MNTTEFDEIRPYNGEKLSGAFEELIISPVFQKVVVEVIPDVPFEVLAQKIRACKTKLESQKTSCYGLLWKLTGEHTDDISLNHTAILGKSRTYTYISNRRDIIFNSGFLSVLLVDQGMDTVGIAIGDNLLTYPWARGFARVSKSSTVQHALTMWQMLEPSARTSRYMHYTIGQKNQPIRIAQREGCAKDSNDCTQDSVPKMLAMGGKDDVVNRLMEMNIAPLAISYEYGPCGYLEAQGFQLKRGIEGYRETMEDDLKNMQAGLFGYKGKVYFQTRVCLSDLLSTMDRPLSKPELFIRTFIWINGRIHGNYRFHPGNYVTRDLLAGKNDPESHCTLADKQRFEAYIGKQFGKIEILDKGTPLLRERLLPTYANPLMNHLVAHQ